MTLKMVNITKREKSDIMCLMMENIRVYSLAKGSYYELDEVSESSCQFTRNTKDHEYTELHHEYAINKAQILRNSVSFLIIYFMLKCF